MAGDSPDQEVVVRMILYGVVIVAFVLTVAIMPTVHLGGYTEPMNSHSIEYESAYTQCVELVKRENCAPILVRLAWHDSGNYDINTHTGGATGSIRFDKELAHGGNAGLKVALKLLQPIMKEHPRISRADIIQMASAAAIQASGGPKIPMKYGRIDATSPSEVPEEGRLPTAGAPFHKATGPHPMEASLDESPAAHLRAVFYRMGLEDEDIVALSGAHTIGRAHKSRSGACPVASTSLTENGPGSTKGGMSWTRNWLEFDNSYFTSLVDAKEGVPDDELLRLSTDMVLLEDTKFKKHAQIFAENQKAFFKAYARSHKKLSELGSTFNPPQGIRI